MEGAPELVGVIEFGVGQFQCASVSGMDMNYLFVECVYSLVAICSDLLSLPNGAISYSMGSTDIRPINTIATQSCNDGYTLNGDTTRTCGSDGVWNGSVPTCQRK